MFAGNFTTEAQVMRDRYEERTNHAIRIVKNAMESSSRELWMCDPKKHEQGKKITTEFFYIKKKSSIPFLVSDKTYLEITQLLQGYVQNEVDLNSEGTCRENCAEYTYTKSHGCFNNQFCQQQRRCNGKILNCQFFDSDMWICPAVGLVLRPYLIFITKYKLTMLSNTFYLLH